MKDFFSKYYFTIIWILAISISVGVYVYVKSTNKESSIDEEKAGIEAAIVNYKTEVDKYAAEFNLPAPYLMAVIMLECSGRKNIKPRFEKEVYKKLKLLKKKEILKFENLTPKTVETATNEALQNMATSWGPFQLMGYKCTFLNIKLRELRGEDAIYWGVKWIDITYGKYLREGKFTDAFHIHNTGHEFPENGKPFTYDTNYVDKGLHYMKYFIKLDSINHKNTKIEK